MDTFNLWEDILGFFSYSIFLVCTFFSLCVCGREKGWVRFPQLFYSLANIYTRVNAGVYSIYTIQQLPHFFIGPFYPFYYFSFFFKFFFQDLINGFFTPHPLQSPAVWVLKKRKLEIISDHFLKKEKSNRGDLHFKLFLIFYPYSFF